MRLRLGLSQTAFVAHIGVSRNTVVGYEHQGQHPKAEILDRIAQAGGVSSEWLLHGRRRGRAQPRSDLAWEKAVKALLAVWQIPERRRLVLNLMRVLARRGLGRSAGQF